METKDSSEICAYQLALQRDFRGEGKTFRMYQPWNERKRLANYNCYSCNGENIGCDSNPLNAF